MYISLLIAEDYSDWNWVFFKDQSDPRSVTVSFNEHLSFCVVGLFWATENVPMILILKKYINLFLNMKKNSLFEKVPYAKFKGVKS